MATETMAEYVARRGITVEIVRDRGTQIEDGWEHHAYVLALKLNGRTLETPWKQGLGVESSPTDDAATVLDSLVRDAAAGAEGMSWEQFADEYGYDVDSLKAFRTWEACRDIYAPLCKWLGGTSQYRRIVESVESL